MIAIKVGQALIATDASGNEFSTRALSGIERGHKFPVVWIECTTKQGQTLPVPWPVESVRPS